MAKDAPFAHFANHIVHKLKDRGFVFIVSDPVMLQNIEQQLQKVDESNAKILPWMVKIAGFLYGMPAPLGALMSNFMTIKHKEVDTSAIQDLFEKMQQSFPFNALRLSGRGIQYLACFNCDYITSNHLTDKAQLFGELSWRMKQVIGKIQGRLLGIPITRSHESPVHASLCLTFTDQQAFNAMTNAVAELNLRKMTIGERLQWLKIYSPIWGLLSPPKGEVHLEKIIYQMYNNHIKSSRRFRTTGAYGFSLNDLIMP